jgi:hypothetical protein
MRLLIEDVTLVKAEAILVHVRLSGGATRTLTLDRPLPIAQIRKFKPDVVAEVDRLLDQHCDREIADIFNQRGLHTWEGKPYNLKKIAFIRTAYGLASRHQRLRSRGMLTTREVAVRFRVSESAVHQWGREGLIRKCYSDNLHRGLWKFHLARRSSKVAVDGARARRASRPSPRQHLNKVHYETIVLSRGL